MSTENTNQNGDGLAAQSGTVNMQAPSHPLTAAPLPSPTTPLFVFPWFSGSTGMSKFSGEKTGAAFSQWKDNLVSMFRIQNIPPNMQKELVLSLLEGEARRQIMILSENNRDTVDKLFNHLSKLYGDKVPASVLRSMYFNCRQESRESVRAFALRLQELFQRLKKKDGESLAREDVLLRDQFIDGQRDVVLRRELRTKLLLNPNISFADIQQEAIIRTEAYGEEEVAAQVYYTEQARTTSSEMELGKVKDELRNEIMGEIKQQMASLSQGILQELRSEIKPWGQNAYGPPGPQMSPSLQSWGSGPSLSNYPFVQPFPQQAPAPPVPTPAQAWPQWQGHPYGQHRERSHSAPSSRQTSHSAGRSRVICHRCKQPGHIERHCPEPAPTQQMALNSATQP